MRNVMLARSWKAPGCSLDIVPASKVGNQCSEQVCLINNTIDDSKKRGKGTGSEKAPGVRTGPSNHTRRAGSAKSIAKRRLTNHVMMERLALLLVCSLAQLTYAKRCHCDVEREQGFPRSRARRPIWRLAGDLKWVLTMIQPTRALAQERRVLLASKVHIIKTHLHSSYAPKYLPWCYCSPIA